MPTAREVAENKLVTLDRLLRGDRIIWQLASERAPEGVWWEGHPQLGRPKLWLSTCKQLRNKGHITVGLRPKDSTYRDYTHVEVYVATPSAEQAFIDLPVFDCA